ncbi:MAG: histidinol dehydrogenase, partial [Lysobacter spongiicola]|nr:histidinol dehydrogenase [Lysobacter spongiicola]
GTNHVLPTGGAARFTGGLNVSSFQVAITVQEVDRRGLQAIGPCAVELANAEGLGAHARAVSVRLDAA